MSGTSSLHLWYQDRVINVLLHQVDMKCPVNGGGVLWELKSCIINSGCRGVTPFQTRLQAFPKPAETNGESKKRGKRERERPEGWGQNRDRYMESETDRMECVCVCVCVCHRGTGQTILCL